MEQGEGGRSLGSHQLYGPGIYLVDIMERGTVGCYYATGLHTRPHYQILEEDLKSHKATAESRNINPRFHPAGGPANVFVDGAFKTFLCNGKDLEGLVKELDMPSIYRDSILRIQKKGPP